MNKIMNEAEIKFLTLNSVRLEASWVTKVLCVLMAFTMGLFFIEKATACYTSEEIASANNDVNNAAIALAIGTASALAAQATAAALLEIAIAAEASIVGAAAGAALFAAAVAANATAIYLRSLITGLATTLTIAEATAAYKAANACCSPR
jgi:hypothetical protein